MLTFVVPESGSAAAALRAIVNAGSKLMMLAEPGMLGDWWWCEVEGELGHGRKRLTNSGDGPLIRQPADSGLIFLRPAPNPTLCRP
jgi:hypothetical protein